MACSASGKSFGRGPCPRWPARREQCPTVAESHRSASEKSSGRGPRAGAASGKRSVGNGGFARF